MRRRNTGGTIMRIGIDARFYGPKKQKGLGRYLQELISGLEAMETNCEFVIFLRSDNWDEYQSANIHFKKVLADYRWYTLAEQIMMPLKIWQAGVDLMHFPHFNIPIFCPTDFVVTIHDLILKHFPTRRASKLGPIRYRLKNWGYKLVIWLAVKRAKKIIAVSQYTKKDIINNFKIEANKIKVIYEGAPIWRQKNTKFTGEALFKRFNISKPYLLYVGNAYPHKNLENLVLSFKKLTNNHDMDLQLILVGQIDYFYKRLRKFADDNGICEKIIFTDFVSDEDLLVLYHNAALYIFPSNYEGFGLPPLEAMTCGSPVVSSRASCLPEILGQAALYFNPADTDDIVDKVKQVLSNSKIKNELILQGYQVIKKYSWQKMAKETFNKVYGLF